MIRRALVVLVAFAVTGCGAGRAVHALPSGIAGAAGGPRAVQSSNVALLNGTLWYGTGAAMTGVPLSGAPGVSLAGTLAGIDDPSPRTLTVAPDGTIYRLIASGSSPARWTLFVYAPGAHGSDAPEQVITGGGVAQQVVLVGDAIDVMSRNPAGVSIVRSYRYAAGDHPAPFRIVEVGTDAVDVASDADDRLYVARAHGTIDVYACATDGTRTTLGTIATNLMLDDIAVARDGTVYAEGHDASASTETVEAFAPGNAGPAPTRTLGQYDLTAAAASAAGPFATVRIPSGGVTVDWSGDVYVGYATSDATTHVDVYTSLPSGTNVARTIDTPAAALSGIAIGPPPVVSVSPTLYVAAGNVYAYPRAADGSVVPQQTYTGFYRASGPGPQSNVSSRIAGIAAGSDGALDVLTSAQSGPQNFSCALISIPQPATAPQACDGLGGQAIAKGVYGEIDVLLTGFDGAQHIERRSHGLVTGTITLPGASPFTYHSLAVSPIDGSMFTVNSTTGSIEVYGVDQSGAAAPKRTFALDGTIGALASGPDGTLYAAVAKFTRATQGNYVEAIPARTSAPASAIGPFPNQVVALAVASGGRLFVGINGGTVSGSKVKVYAPGADGNATPERVILNPVPSNDPAGTAITGLAVAP